MTPITLPFLPQFDHLLGGSSWLDKMQGITAHLKCGNCWKGERYNNDTETHLDTGYPYFDANLLEGYCFRFTWLLLYVFWGGVSLHMTKRLCSKSGHIVEFSKDMDSFGFM